MDLILDLLKFLLAIFLLGPLVVLIALLFVAWVLWVLSFIFRFLK